MYCAQADIIHSIILALVDATQHLDAHMISYPSDAEAAKVYATIAEVLVPAQKLLGQIDALEKIQATLVREATQEIKIETVNSKSLIFFS